MRDYFRVTTTFDDKGRVRAFVETVRADQKPENTFYEGKRADVYEDYFETAAEAKKFAADAKKA